jgi:hypothetical protein
MRMEKEDIILLKISGTEKSVQKFLEKLKKTYGMLMVGKLLPNDDDSGIHCFVDVNVESEVTQAEQ